MGNLITEYKHNTVRNKDVWEWSEHFNVCECWIKTSHSERQMWIQHCEADTSYVETEQYEASKCWLQTTRIMCDASFSILTKYYEAGVSVGRSQWVLDRAAIHGSVELSRDSVQNQYFP